MGENERIIAEAKLKSSSLFIARVQNKLYEYFIRSDIPKNNGLNSKFYNRIYFKSVDVPTRDYLYEIRWN